MRFILLVCTMPIVALTAGCSSEPDVPDTVAGNQSLADRSATGAAAVPPGDPADGARTPAPDLPPVPPVTDEPAAGSRPLPLERGVYVLADSSCRTPANAAFRVWNGTGLSGSTTRACRSEAATRDGRTFQLSNSCENTYDGSRSTERLTVEMTGPGRFGIDDGEFRLCPAGEAPSWLRTLAEAPREAPAAAAAVVPPRFRGLFAPDRRACARDYTYNPAFQNVEVKAREVSFFETGGPVTDVRASGDRVAITLRETVGDNVVTRAIYFALNQDGSVRYRAAESEPPRTFVRCGADRG